MPREGRLAGRSCLIVGGTGGIGLATARRFLEEGARVVVSGAPAQAGAVGREGLEALGPVWDYQADVSRVGEVDALVEFAAGVLDGRIDVLFHVSGISGRRLGDGPLRDCSIEGWDRVFEVNARGTFLTNRAVLRRMLDQDRDPRGVRGSVVNVGSVLDRSPSPEHFGTVAYAASKGAVRALTLAAAAKYAAEGIRFNLIEPGLVDTPMAARAVGDEGLRPFLRSKQPLPGGPLDAADVAEAAVYLCGPESSRVTGAVLTVDGGWCASEGHAVPEENP